MLALWGAIIGETEGNAVTHLVLSVHHYVGFFLLLALFSSFFLFREYYKYVVFIALLAGVFNLAYFSGATFVVTLGSSFTIQPLSLFVACLFFALNTKKISQLPEKYGSMVPDKPYFSEEEKVKFRGKYQNFTNEQLNTIRSDLKYKSEARRAAEELLTERVTPEN